MHIITYILRAIVSHKYYFNQSDVKGNMRYSHVSKIKATLCHKGWLHTQNIIETTIIYRCKFHHQQLIVQAFISKQKN